MIVNLDQNDRLERLEVALKEKDSLIHNLKTKIIFAENALEYYSNRDNWQVEFDPISGMPICQAQLDSGSTALTVLQMF